MKNKLFLITIFTILLALQSPIVKAQCPMCRATLESNLKQGGTAGNGMNKGILYMFAMPYLIVGSIAFIWWRNRRKESELNTYTLPEEQWN